MSKQKSKKKTEKGNSESLDERRQELLGRVATDPKFMMPGKALRKVEIDDRFKEMFHSNKFGVTTSEKSLRKNRELADFYYTKDGKEEGGEEESEEEEEVLSSDYEGDGIIEYLVNE